jgi:hypothetical protein
MKEPKGFLMRGFGSGYINDRVASAKGIVEGIPVKAKICGDIQNISETRYPARIKFCIRSGKKVKSKNIVGCRKNGLRDT